MKVEVVQLYYYHNGVTGKTLLPSILADVDVDGKMFYAIETLDQSFELQNFLGKKFYYMFPDLIYNEKIKNEIVEKIHKEMQHFLETEIVEDDRCCKNSSCSLM